MANQALPLSHLVQIVGNTLRKELQLQRVWVVAELSDVRMAGGHCYMELIEKNDSGQTVAKLRANIWASSLQEIRRKFFAATQKDIISGLKVMVCGSVTHHNIYGMSFNIHDIDPSYTLGDMERMRQEILQKLRQLGVIDMNKQIPLVSVPQRIAVISAEGAAGYGDFMDQLLHNPHGFVFYPHLFPAVMQGERTGESVISALDMIEMTIDLWDCVVIIRGGGATTDLNGFDDLKLAYKVATFALPVIVGIGHERDKTVLDEIACVRQKTPTAVAEFLVLRLLNAYNRAIELATQVRGYAVQRLHGEERHIAGIEALIPSIIERRLGNAKTLLASLARTLPSIAGARVMQARSKLQNFAGLISMASHSPIEKGKLRLEQLQKEVQREVSQKIGDENKRLAEIEKLVAVLDPTSTLRRGYSITRVNGHALCDASMLHEGDEVTTTLASSSFTSTVKKINRK